MKFGEYLNTEKDPEWQHFYLDYDQLKGMIKELEEIHLAVPNESSKGKNYCMFYYYVKLLLVKS